ncbi:MAG: hypothetical protein AAF518_00515 [Spirochaetota bacterium]
MKNKKPTPDPARTTKYPFLNIYKEKEAVVMGLVPSSKYQQVLFSFTRKHSTISAVASGNLVSIKEMQIDKNKMKRAEVLEILNQLISIKLVVHVVAFAYDPFQRKLRPRSFFLAHPPSDKTERLEHVFEQLIYSSVDAFKNWVEMRDSLKTDIFRRTLEKQLTSSNPTEFYESGSSVIEVAKEIREKNFEVPISEELMDYTAKEIRKRLVGEKIAISLPNQYVMMLKESEIEDHYEVASDFIENRLIGTLKSEPKFKQSLDKILMEEAKYNIERFTAKTGKFIAKKALQIKKIKSQKGSIEYPGSLAVETIINLEHQVERIYSSNWKQECGNQTNDFKKPLLNLANRWDSLIRFVEHAHIKNFPQEVWHELTNDLDLFYSTWETDKTKVHVFASREPKVYKTVIAEMEKSPRIEHWKVLATRNLIEENEDKLKELFADNLFKLHFGRLMKRVYIEYMPWYYRLIFFLISFGFFQDHFFQKAKSLINQQQEALRSDNEARNKEVYEKEEKERDDKLRTIMKNKMSNSIIEVLDRAFFVENVIPDLQYVLRFFPELNSEQLRDTLKRESFQIIEFLRKGNPKLELVLHPINQDWHRKKVRLLRLLDKNIEVLNKDFASDGEMLSLAKSQKLKTFMETKTEENRPTRKVGGGTDPYIRLDRRIKKMDEVEKNKEEEG